MFRFTKKVDYGLLLLSRLTTQSGQSARLLAESTGLSQPIVANLMKVLVQSGLVNSIRGKSGGYVLARAKNEITIADAISSIDGPYRLIDCLDHEDDGNVNTESRELSGDPCDLIPACPCRPLFSMMHSEIMSIMRKYTVAHVSAGHVRTSSGRMKSAHPLPVLQASQSE